MVNHICLFRTKLVTIFVLCNFPLQGDKFSKNFPLEGDIFALL